MNVDLANSQPLIFGVIARDWLRSTGKARQRLAGVGFTDTNPYNGTHKRLGAGAPSAGDKPGPGNARNRNPGKPVSDSGPTAPPVSTTNITNPLPPKLTRKPHPYYEEMPPVTPCAAKRLGKGGSAPSPAPADLKEYLRVCEAGTFYESLLTEADRSEGKRARARLKVRFYRVLFGRNKARSRFRNELKARFRSLYPTAAGVLKALKARNYRHSSHVLQNTEATVFIYRACGRIMREKPDAFVATIHDSILTTPENVEYVEGVIHDEFAKLGVSPTLKREAYAETPKGEAP